MNPIEQEVVQMLRMKVSQAPVREEPPPAVIRKTRTLRVVNAVGAMAAAAAVVVGVVLGVRVSNDPKTLEPLGPVPWVGVEPQPAVERALPQCRVSQVAATAMAQFEGARIDFSLKGNEPCQLWPVLKIGVRDAEGRHIPSLISGNGYSVYLDPGVRAPFGITSMARCGPHLATLSFVVTIPDQNGELVVRPSPIVAVPPGGDIPAPACTDESPLRLHFTAMPPVALPAPPPNPAVVDPLEYSMRVPSTVNRDGVLHYQVTIVNESARPATLDPCPVYWQVLLSPNSSRGQQYFLNCAVFDGVIPAKSEVTFQMQMNLAGMDPGEWMLTWALEDLDSQMTANVRIV